jgi:hypothetical protein
MYTFVKDLIADDIATISFPQYKIAGIPDPSQDKSLHNDTMRNIELHRLAQYYTDMNQKSLETKDIPS